MLHIFQPYLEKDRPTNIFAGQSTLNLKNSTFNRPIKTELQRLSYLNVVLHDFFFSFGLCTGLENPRASAAFKEFPL